MVYSDRTEAEERLEIIDGVTSSVVYQHLNSLTWNNSLLVIILITRFELITVNNDRRRSPKIHRDPFSCQNHTVSLPLQNVNLSESSATFPGII